MNKKFYVLSICMVLAGCGADTPDTSEIIHTQSTTEVQQVALSEKVELLMPDGTLVATETVYGGNGQLIGGNSQFTPVVNESVQVEETTSGEENFEENNTASENPNVQESTSDNQNPTQSDPTKETSENMKPTGNTYLSELTNEAISVNLKYQRPIAVMVDNEKVALQHYGTSKADIVYELMNSTENNGITRLMCIYKDWKSVERIGSIRSTRTTNIMLAAEYNAILCHDGGPFYINEYLAKGYTKNLSGGFSRINNGKSREFTEYICEGEVLSRINSAGYDINYTNEEQHFKFNDNAVMKDAKSCSKVELPFYHNSSCLTLVDGKYRYSEYGAEYIDALTNSHMDFTNVILQRCYYTKLDDNGYLTYDVVSPGIGYYIHDGKAIQIDWLKQSEAAATKFYYHGTSDPLELATGKTYIALVPADTWDALVIQ